MRLLVTGVAGDIGNGIGRILRNHKSVTKLIGCDIHDQHTGSFVFDVCRIVPRVDDPSYIEELLNIAKQYEVDAILPASEPELRFFANENLFDFIDTIPLVTANSKAVQVGFDKLITSKFLAEHNLPFPWTSAVTESYPKELPCIIKSRTGAGGQGVMVVDDSKLLSSYRKIFPNYIWQELVGSKDEEYTCGVYRSLEGEVRSILIRRRLSAGVTVYGEVVADSQIEKLCIDIAVALELTGSINVQLRLTRRGPVVFEINPRFSSTIVFRHKLGFEDLIWAISEKLNGELPPYKTIPKAGSKIFRRFDEAIL